MSAIKWDAKDLLPEGERVAPWAIEQGLMRETKVIYQGRVRYLPLVTKKGVAMIAELIMGGA